MNRHRSTWELYEAARLYYLVGARQDEVADKLNVSRSNVSRILRAAREQGIIRFHLTYPGERDHRTEQRLLTYFENSRLQDAVVVRGTPAGTAVDPLELVGAAAAEWLLGHLTDGVRISVGWGTSVRATIGHVFAQRGYVVEVNQLGGDVDVVASRGSHDMVRDLAARLGGTYSYLQVPAVLDSAAAAKALYGDAAVAYELERARAADIAIVGIGAFDCGSNRLLLERAGVSREERLVAGRRGVVGEICGRFFDRDGARVSLPVDQRIISVHLADLVTFPTTVGVAAGAAKGRAVTAAVRGGLVRTLVCDIQLAHAVLAVPADEATDA